jgi:regulator of replication initiation timing
MSDEYQTVYGDLVNSLMALKRHLALMVDEGLEAMNIPSRSEINTLQKRQQELRRENHALRAEIESLKDMMQKTTSRSSAATEAKPKAATKKTTRKTSAK